MKPARVIVTRPAQDAQHWVQWLRQTGADAETLALIDIAPLAGAADANALHVAWQTLPDYAACLFVSGHAVVHFFKEKTAFLHEGRAEYAIDNVANQAFGDIPAGLRFMAPGPGTVAALRAAGIVAAQIDAPPTDAGQFDSEALWQVISQRDWRGQRVLIVRGQSAGAEGGSPGRDWIARQWLAAGASVDFVAVYQRRAPVLSPAQLERARAASADGSVWLFSSSEAIANLLRLDGLQQTDWSGALAIATHGRIAQTARAAGWGVVVESRPAMQDIRDALGSIESRHP